MHLSVSEESKTQPTRHGGERVTMRLRLHEVPLRTRFQQSSTVISFVCLLQSHSLKTL